LISWVAAKSVYTISAEKLEGTLVAEGEVIQAALRWRLLADIIEIFHGSRRAPHSNGIVEEDV
jgi:hypothetical protein